MYILITKYKHKHTYKNWIIDYYWKVLLLYQNINDWHFKPLKTFKVNFPSHLWEKFVFVKYLEYCLVYIIEIITIVISTTKVKYYTII
jgi:hypothetical protein